ncbi:hypothetical protein HK102_003435 [Quaeritorhiza haematococci]|nr:hypothetical protein HK102_003435 [Quaeritorhiza haematococci]
MFHIPTLINRIDSSGLNDSRSDKDSTLNKKHVVSLAKAIEKMGSLHALIVIIKSTADLNSAINKAVPQYIDNFGGTVKVIFVHTAYSILDHIRDRYEKDPDETFTLPLREMEERIRAIEDSILKDYENPEAVRYIAMDNCTGVASKFINPLQRAFGIRQISVFIDEIARSEEKDTTSIQLTKFDDMKLNDRHPKLSQQLTDLRQKNDGLNSSIAKWQEQVEENQRTIDGNERDIQEANNDIASIDTDEEVHMCRIFGLTRALAFGAMFGGGWGRVAEARTPHRITRVEEQSVHEDMYFHVLAREDRYYRASLRATDPDLAAVEGFVDLFTNKATINEERIQELQQNVREVEAR